MIVTRGASLISTAAQPEVRKVSMRGNNTLGVTAEIPMKCLTRVIVPALEEVPLAVLLLLSANKLFEVLGSGMRRGFTSSKEVNSKDSSQQENVSIVGTL